MIPLGVRDRFAGSAPGKGPEDGRSGSQETCRRAPTPHQTGGLNDERLADTRPFPSPLRGPCLRPGGLLIAGRLCRPAREGAGTGPRGADHGDRHAAALRRRGAQQGPGQRHGDRRRGDRALRGSNVAGPARSRHRRDPLRPDRQLRPDHLRPARLHPRVGNEGLPRRRSVQRSAEQRSRPAPRPAGDAGAGRDHPRLLGDAGRRRFRGRRDSPAHAPRRGVRRGALPHRRQRQRVASGR